MAFAHLGELKCPSDSEYTADHRQPGESEIRYQSALRTLGSDSPRDHTTQMGAEGLYRPQVFQF